MIRSNLTKVLLELSQLLLAPHEPAGYRDGVDVEEMMPYLSTYLGHTDPKHTYWYLSAAPKLMALAGQRLHMHLEGRS